MYFQLGAVKPIDIGDSLPSLTLKNEIVKIAPKGRVNCVAPGWVDTPMAGDALKNPDVVYRALATFVFFSSLYVKNEISLETRTI